MIWVLGLALGATALITIRERSSRYALLFILLLLELSNQTSLSSRAVLENGVFLPGTLTSRLLLSILPESTSALLRRSVDPGIWLLFATLLSLSSFFLGSVFCLFLAFCCELLALGFSEAALALPSWVQLMHGAALCGAAISLLLGLSLQTFRAKAHTDGRKARGMFFGLCLIVTTGLGVFSIVKSRFEQPPHVLAHYYSWFPENWKGGYYGEKLQPPLQPTLGLYKSGTPEVVHAHALMAKERGVNCFVLDWWPSRPAFRERIFNAGKQLSQQEGMCTVLLYETLDIRQPHERRKPGERINVVFLSRERSQRMAEQWVRLTKDYMQNPHYLRIQGRPVLFLYATRHLVGDVGQRIAEAREYVRAKTGENLYLVGDEVYFEVPEGDGEVLNLLPTHEPSWARVTSFDALFLYNPYDASRSQHGGSSGVEQFVADTERLHSRYFAVAAQLGMPFFPLALVGYDDTAHRPREKHFPIPRVLPSGETLLEASRRRWVRPFLSTAQNISTLTSWNEWNEGSQLEPSETLP